MISRLPEPRVERVRKWPLCPAIKQSQELSSIHIQLERVYKDKDMVRCAITTHGKDMVRRAMSANGRIW